MNDRWIALAGIVGLASGVLGCMKLVSSLVEKKDGGEGSSNDNTSPFWQKSAACDLVTEAEILASTHSSVASHKGDKDSCDWTMKEGGTLTSLHLALLVPFAAKLIPQFGKVVEVQGLGERAQWTQGMVQDLRVQQKGKVLYILPTPSPSAIMGGTKFEPGKVVNRQTVPNGAVETQEINMENPELKNEVVAFAQAAIKRL